jgi:hypothetical protein
LIRSIRVSVSHLHADNAIIGHPKHIFIRFVVASAQNRLKVISTPTDKSLAAAH